MEYKEITLKDGSVFKGMVRVNIPISKRKHISGTGEFTYATDGTIYKGALKKGQPHGFGEKYWPQQDGKVYKGYW